MYRVEVDWAPAFELLISLGAFANKSEHRLLDLGPEWIRELRRMLPGDFLRMLNARDVPFRDDAVDLLIHRCPEDRSAPGFLAWLADLSPGDIYELVAPEALQGWPLPPDLGAERDRWVALLDAWNGIYFKDIDPAILPGLEADASRTRAAVEEMPPEALVERATNGVQFCPEPLPETVLLVPQYHYRPWNVFSSFRSTKMIAYPVDALPAVRGEPSADLMHLTRALADESRLRILRDLAEGPRTFSEIARSTSLAKSTVHHHMVALRAAGLIRVRVTGGKSDVYSLRPGAVERVGESLNAYLTSGRDVADR